jgi:hypothetical protein
MDYGSSVKPIITAPGGVLTSTIANSRIKEGYFALFVD